jgi:hypothetical protein
LHDFAEIDFWWLPAQRVGHRVIGHSCLVLQRNLKSTLLSNLWCKTFIWIRNHSSCTFEVPLPLVCGLSWDLA